MLVDNLELLAQVVKVLEVYRNNKELAISLFEIGIHKKDGKPYGTDRVGRIKYVASHMQI